MKNRRYRYILFLLPLLALGACKDKKQITIVDDKFEAIDTYLNIPHQPYNYANPELPPFFNNQFIQFQNNSPIDNPVTNWGATLGRVLFYDKDLSINSTISCASCHNQSVGFTDTSMFSQGFNVY